MCRSDRIAGHSEAGIHTGYSRAQVPGRGQACGMFYHHLPGDCGVAAGMAPAGSTRMAPSL
jgi:hypothetical protein